MNNLEKINSCRARQVGSSASPARTARPSLYSQYFKRYLDIIFTVIVLPIFIPLIIVLAAAIFLLDQKNPFFAHKRVGRNGKIFKCLKLRTMVVNAENILPQMLNASPERLREWSESQKLTDDPRVTRIGRFLRATSLDEIPQLLNVLSGEMSLVGPRPIVTDELKRYGRGAASYLRMRPGVTGMWQTTGRNDVSYAERVSMDIEYEHNMSLWTDLKIMVMTVVAMLAKTGR
ncbi:sugar transferase [Paracoccus nototheniae]|uniref:Sugar transferase n=1 Tax=Paracoccus nototheniae TaxID=2489002 RepID=A0ABW4E4R4_9RHOB|nr:sugar transferase [Paracoccus nototheniae]